MRVATQKIKELYGTQLGQDVIETLTGAGFAAGGQALFTEMTPEEIALSTAAGIGAASIGRPLVGRSSQFIGNQLSRNPGVERQAQQALNWIMEMQPNQFSKDVFKAKLQPYAHLPASAQLGQIIGRGYGDNIAQGVVALAAPGLIPDNSQES